MELKGDAKIWEKLKNLKIGDPLPEEFPDYFYTHIHSYLQAGKFSERIEPFLRHFPRQKYTHLSLCTHPQSFSSV